MPLTIRVETVKSIDAGQQQENGFNFSSPTSINSSESFNKLVGTAGGLISLKAAQKIGYEVNSAIGAYTMNYTHEKQINDMISTITKASSIIMPFAVGGFLIGMGSLAVQTANFAKELYYDQIQTRNFNYGVSYLRSIVGSSRKENGRIGL